MKAVVYHGHEDFRIDSIPDAAIQAPTDEVEGCQIFASHSAGVLKVGLTPRGC